MKIRISKFLSFIALLLVTVIFFASCDAFQGAISSGALNQKKLFDGKTPKDLYGSSINKYKNKGNGLIYCVEIEWSKSETSNDSAKVKLVYSDDDLYYTSIVSSADNQEIEAITLKGNKMYYLTKNGSKHLYSSNHDDVLSYIENYTKVKEVHQAFPDNLPNSWFDNLEFNLTEDGSYAVSIDVDEKKSKDHPKYSNFYQPGCKCNLYFDDKGDLKRIALKNVSIDGVNNDVTVRLSWGDGLKIEEPSDKDSYVDKGVFDRDKLNDSDDDSDDNTNLHTHSYSVLIKREPTCTVQGYTIYSCDCSDTYVGDYVDAHGHNYVNNICTYCADVLKVSEGLSYVLSDDETHYMVSGIGSCMDTDIVIPEEHNGLPVSAVANFAFRACSTIKSVVIPNSILSIGWYGFYGCENLERVEIGSSVSSIWEHAFTHCQKLISISVNANNSSYKSIDGNLYTKDGKVFIQYALGKTDKNFVVPDTVDTICLRAFSQCAYITSVTIPNSVTTIGDGIFLACENLVSVVLPENITSISYEMFCGCMSLTSIIIPEGVTKIEGCAVERCTNLEDVVIPSSVTYIDECAFASCDSLIFVYYGGTEGDWESIYIEEYANDVITSATRYYYSETQPTTKGNFWHYVDGVVTVWQSYTSEHKHSYNKVVTEPTCTEQGYTTYICDCNESYIDDYKDAKGHVYVNYVCTVCNHYYYSEGLAFRSNGDGTCSVGLGDAQKLDSNVVIPPVSPAGDSVIEIPGHAFFECFEITKLVIPDSVKTIETCAFASCYGLEEVIIGSNVTKIGEEAFFACPKLTKVTLSNGITVIGDRMFANCSRLVDIIIPESVTKIGYSAFSGCTSLTAITIPGSVKTVDFDAFYNCSSLTDVIICDGAEIIGESMFSSCTSLKNIIIPDSVTSICDFAFRNCTALENIYYTGSEEEWKAISISEYNNSLKNATIHYNYVPEE